MRGEIFWEVWWCCRASVAETWKSLVSDGNGSVRFKLVRKLVRILEIWRFRFWFLTGSVLVYTGFEPVIYIGTPQTGSKSR